MKPLLVLVTALCLSSCALPLARHEIDRALEQCQGQGGLAQMKIGTRLLEAHCSNGMEIVIIREITKVKIPDK